MASDIAAKGGQDYAVGDVVVGMVVAIGDGNVSDVEFSVEPGWAGKVVMVEPDDSGKPLRVHVEIATGNAEFPDDGIVQVYEGEELATSIRPSGRNEVVVDARAKELAETAGFSVGATKDGGWTWEGNGMDSSAAFDAVDGGFGTEGAAWDSAAFEAASMVMGAQDLDSEAWDAMDHAKRIEAAEAVFGTRPAP